MQALNDRFRKLILVGWLPGLILSGCAHFRPTPPPPPLPPPPAPVREVRAVWLTRFEYCQVTRTHDQDSIRTFIAEVIDNAARTNFNIIFFQVRGNGDAYYTPGLEPWGVLLTDTLGKDPGWDPLQFALDRAHARGLELHAWLNTFPVWRGLEPPPETVPRSPFLEHPEWVVCDSSGTPMPLSEHYVSFSPGIPAVQDYLISVAVDILTRYDVDGIHFDYIRYPEGAPDNGYSHDSSSVGRFNSEAGNPHRLDWDDWQREQLTTFVTRMYNAVQDVKPWVKMSAAVIGSYNTGRWNAYHSVYQDARRWTELGKIDFITPMIYWPREGSPNPFMLRSREWQQYYTLDRYVFPGIGSYRYNTTEENYTWSEATGQVEDLRREGIPGMVFFAAQSLSGHWESLAREHFRTPANLPPMPWKDAIPPSPPQNLGAAVQNDTLRLVWELPDSADVVRFNVYASRILPVDSAAAENLLLVTVEPAREVILPGAKSFNLLFLAVSALDAAWNESRLSDPVQIVVK